MSSASSGSSSSSATAASTRPLNVADYQRRAKERLPQMVYDYYAGGARDEVTLHGNRSACDRLSLRYRVMRDIRDRSTATTVLGEPVDVPVLVKSIVRGDDAARAVEHGAAGVVVSNHGGRQLDTAPPTIDVLPDIVDAVGDTDAAIIVDGGIRRGTDILKALALGADAVAVGRPILWGLATGGEAGARHVLQLLRDELDNAMALCGARRVADLTPDLVRRAP